MAAGDADTRIRFGISLVPAIESLHRTRELARAADDAALDLVGIQDHPYQRHFLDTWSLIPTLLAETKGISFFTDVANLPLRPPAVMAKAAATLDVLSGGRFELGLGSGGYWEAIKTFGVTPLSRAQAVDALEEAVAVIRALWSGDRAVHFNGSYYRLDGATGGPPPPHPIGIWLGAQGARLLATTGRLADGWAAPIPSYLPYERWAAAQTTIDDAARLAGREPTSIRRLAQVVGAISDRPHGQWEPVGSAPIRGDSSQWAEAVTYLVDELRFDTVVFWPEEASVEQIERFADLATHVSERSQPAATRNQQTTTTEGGSHA
jgi:alkanesulfonate monooxygenase SsuD/methylene tetrahydromethanopterin reductase-like flavin-dependent oxidoreductase (luciferase family)